MTRVIRVEVMVLDFDDLGVDGVRETLENTKYPNRCITPHVMEIEERDIGTWSDEHPLNQHSKQKAFFQELFKSKLSPAAAWPFLAADLREDQDRAFGQPHRGHPPEEN